MSELPYFFLNIAGAFSMAATFWEGCHTGTCTAMPPDLFYISFPFGVALVILNVSRIIDKSKKKNEN